MMALYDFFCARCKVTREVLRGMSQEGPEQCPVCGNGMDKCLQAPAGLSVQGPAAIVDSPYKSVRQAHKDQHRTVQYTHRSRGSGR